MTPEDELKLLEKINTLIESMPALARPIGGNNSQKWLAETYAVVSATGDSKDADDLKDYINKLIDHANNTDDTIREKPARKIEAILRRAYETLRLKIAETD